MANREVFGKSKDVELELAYLLENIRDGKTGFFEVENVLLVAPPSVGEVWLYGEKIEKIKLPTSGIFKIKINPERKTKLKVSGKEWTGAGKEMIYFDI